jgi:hypothetical protein
VGAPNGVSSSRPFDRWFRYPAGFSPATLAAALEVADAANGVLIDPFAGSASAGCRVIADGATYVGIEAHPLIGELGELKFRRPGEPRDLLASARCAAKPVVPLPVTDEASLVQRCFDESVLGWLVGMRDQLQQRTPDEWSGHLKWALLGTLRDVASVKVGWPYQRPALQRAAPYVDPSARFLARIEMMAADLEDAPEPASSRVVVGDSTKAGVWKRAMRDQLAVGCVTSPPYLNNFDYADATRLEVYFWREATTWAELCSEIRADMLIATTQQTRMEVAARASERLSVYPSVSAEVDVLVARLAAERARRRRGKEYDRVLAPYFVGIARVLACMHDHLAPGATCAWIIGDSAPYGIHIDTPRLVAALASELGYDVGNDVALRDRGSRWRTNGTRHQVALSERLVSFRRPPARTRAMM